MQQLSRTFSLLLITLLVTACGTKTVAIKGGATANLQKIAIIKVDNPDIYAASDFGNIGLAFGALGAAGAGASTATKTERLTAIMQQEQFQFGEELTRLIQEMLTANHYQSSQVEIERTEMGKPLTDYSGITDQGVDAILDVALINVGYATEHPMLSPQWRPSAQLLVSLVDAKTHEVLLQEKVMYGYHNPFLSGTDVDAPKRFHFNDSDALFASAPQLVDGLKVSANILASHITGHIKR